MLQDRSQKTGSEEGQGMVAFSFSLVLHNTGTKGREDLAFAQYVAFHCFSVGKEGSTVSTWHSITQ